jgi:methyl-accepting chemotaxis protein
MNKSKLASRLNLFSGALVLVLVGVGVAVWLLLGRIVFAADRVQRVNVPQLQRIAELELNVTRVSLQVRHLMLSKTEAQRTATLADIQEKKRLLERVLHEVGDGMVDDEGRAAYAALPALMDAFWRVGGENIALVQAGKIDEAVDYLVERTIPARNLLLEPLAREKQRQAERLNGSIADIREFSNFDRYLILSAVIVVAAGLLGLLIYLRRVVADLGADPDELHRVADAVATGDLRLQLHLRANDRRSVLYALSLMAGQLRETVTRVRDSADSLSSASAQIAAGNADLSTRTEQQASTLQQTAAAAEHLGATVTRNAESAQQANSLASNAAELAARGGSVVGDCVSTMRGIHESSARIAEIINVIDGIAFQTNILALNAAVEAARAGEQGRGFAVVAGEVRGLAQRSASAAREIKTLIQASVERIEAGNQQVGRAGGVMTDIVDAVHRVSLLVSEISSASQEQSQGVRQVGEAVTQMDRGTQQNAAMVEQIAASAASLNLQAEQLVQAVAVFRTH